MIIERKIIRVIFLVLLCLILQLNYTPIKKITLYYTFIRLLTQHRFNFKIVTKHLMFFCNKENLVNYYYNLYYLYAHENVHKL